MEHAAPAAKEGLSRASVHRIWRKYGLVPHRVETFKFSTDPEFDHQLADIVGLYVDPRERALVLCVDEKSQMQALNRTQAVLPIGRGCPHGAPTIAPATAPPAHLRRWKWPAAKGHTRCYGRHLIRDN